MLFTLRKVVLANTDGFEWDDGNRSKVSARMPCEIAESAFLGSPLIFADVQHSAEEPRWALINRVDDRYVFAVFTLRRRRIRIISARFMHQHEVRKYAEVIKKSET